MLKRPKQQLETLAPGGDARGFSFALEKIERRDASIVLALHAHHRHSFGPITIDWSQAEMQRRISAGRRQPLARAVGLHKLDANSPSLSILDATAGLGRDGFTLAALGAQLTLAERNPTVMQLLRDAHQRAGITHSEIAARIELIELDTVNLFAGTRRWDVIYLDPMYPDDGKSALPSKEMQVLHDLTGGDEDADALLKPALDCARLRVVVKRPLKAAWLAGEEPSLSLRSTQLRFDVYLKTAIRLANPAALDFHLP